MPVFAANLSTMFQELPFPMRPAAGAACGFRAVEFQWPYNEDLADLSKVLRTLDLSVALLNMPQGTGRRDRGIAAVLGAKMTL